MGRAYTYIDRANALVGNRWLERRWSSFLGVTVALVDKMDGYDWITGECAEFSLHLGDETLGPLDLGETLWTEDNGPLGATLTCTRDRPDLEVRVSTLAYHDIAAMLRRIRVLNKSKNPLQVRHATLDSIAVGRKTFRALVNGFHETHAAIRHTTDERGVALQLKHRGMIMGHEAPATYALCDPAPPACAIQRFESHVIGAGRWMEWEASYLIPYRGPVADASRRQFADFLAHRRELAEADEAPAGA